MFINKKFGEITVKKFFNEFKNFIMRGNVLDLAVAVIIGSAFGAITTSLVNDLIMPLINALFFYLGWSASSDVLAVVLNGKPLYILDEAGVSTGVINPEAILWNYGNFINAVINFIIIAFVLFIIVKTFNAARAGADKYSHKNSPFTKAELRAMRKAGKTHEEICKAEEEKRAALKLEAKQKAAAEKKPTTEELLTEIRDLLLKQNNKEN